MQKVCVLTNDLGCIGCLLEIVGFGLISVAAGEALEEELNRVGPGSCKFMTCDVSKEEDLKVRASCSFFLSH